MTDKAFVTVGDWALGADELQWMLMRRHQRKGRPSWDPVWFVRSEKDVLAVGMREKGVDAGTAAQLLAGLPDTFDEWNAARHAATSP